MHKQRAEHVPHLVLSAGTSRRRDPCRVKERQAGGLDSTSGCNVMDVFVFEGMLGVASRRGRSNDGAAYVDAEWDEEERSL